jgi:hypothetical protein
VHAAIINPDGEVAAERDAHRQWLRLAVTVPATHGRTAVAVGAVERRRGGLRGRGTDSLSEGIPPYFSDAPGRLVVEE